MSPSPRIAVHGATGRLGQLIVHELGGNLAGIVERNGSIPPCDVIIDVSSPEGTASLVPRLSSQALVVGTTGALPIDALSAHAGRAPLFAYASPD